MKRFLLSLVLVATIAGLTLNPTPAKADKIGNFGAQFGYGGDLDWFIGARAELFMAQIFERSRAVADFNWYFPDGDFNYFEFDLNYLWPLTTLAEDSNSNIYLGGGLNLGRGWVDDFDNWEFGLNVLGGLNWDLSGRAAFVEGGFRFITDYDDFFIETGILF